jgi:GNAT superfamily N-acetyltransferase
MPMGVSVRRLEPADKPRWGDLFRAYIAFYEARVPDPVIETTWQRLMSGGPFEPVGLVAIEDERGIDGLAHLVFHRSTWSATTYCYLEDLFVDPAARRRGLGRALIEATYREADGRGATRTYWATQESNARARALYDQVARLSPFVQYRR